MRSAAALDATFAALADPTRRAILERLAKGEADVTDLARPFSMSRAAVSKHLRVLEEAGLIASTKDAQRRPRTLDARPLAQAATWLARYRAFWEGSYARLDAVLEELQAAPPRPARPRKGRST